MEAVCPKVQADISFSHWSSKLIIKSQHLLLYFVHLEFRIPIHNTFAAISVTSDLSFSQAALLEVFNSGMSEGTTEGGNSQLTRFRLLSSSTCEQDYI